MRAEYWDNDKNKLLLVTEVTKTYFGNLGPDLDILAGDINVGPRKIGFLFGAYRRIINQLRGMLTGKPLPFGGSQMRTEATGYGVMYFLNRFLRKTVMIWTVNLSLFRAQELLRLMELGKQPQWAQR